LIIAFNLLAATVLHVAGQTPLKMRDTTVKGPQTFAIIIGISKYKYVRPLSFADKDAEMFRDYLKSPGGGSVKNENIFCLLNEQVLCSNFWGKGFQWLKAKNLQKGDRLFIYLAGHGDAIDEDQFFFLGYDCNPGGDKNNYLAGGAIQLFNLKKKIVAETTKGVDVFFIMDACRSSELPGGLPGQNFLNSAVSEKKAGEIIMLATAAGQESLEDASLGTGHGLFTYYLVDGLAGTADSIGTLDNKISFLEIQTYVNKNVPTAAQQKFKRNQQPYFCCNENSDKVVGIVDTAYFSNWLKIKMQQRKGPGNYFRGNFTNPVPFTRIDTTVIETYNLFYKAIKNNNITGKASAEYYYDQLDKKFPGDPYTLDAKSTLAVEYIKNAQEKVNRFITCDNATSMAEKKECLEAGARLEKAIGILKEYDPDYANSLMSNMYFLKASGIDNNNTAIQNAYAAYTFAPDAAYINNSLANLHLQNNRADSAAFYARKAVEIAPNWRCGYTTLALAYKALNLPDSASKYQQKSAAPDPTQPVAIRKVAKQKESRKIQVGGVTGGGISKMNPSYSNWDQRNINYNDSLNSITANNGTKYDIGLFCQINISKTVAWRPSILLTFENGDVVYDRKSTTGGPSFKETIKIQTTSINLALPLIFKLSEKNIAPFLSFGPTISYLMKQNAASSSKLSLKSFAMLGDAGLGVDIGLQKAGFILSPEFKFSSTFTDTKENANNLYTNTLSSLKRQAFVFSIYLRQR